MAAEPTAAPSGPGRALPRALARRVGRGVPAALLRYRVMAWVVGVLLVVLFFVAIPVDRLAGIDGATTVVGTLHGWLYAIFFVTACDLAVRARWTLRGTVLVVLAGTVPLLSFYAERVATRRTRAGERV